MVDGAISIYNKLYKYGWWISNIYKRRMTMVELLVTPKSITHMETLIDKGADAFVIGEQNLV